MVHPPFGTNVFEFVVVASLRTAQLVNGCTPRVPAGIRPAVTAQHEVAEGKVRSLPHAGIPDGPAANGDTTTTVAQLNELLDALKRRTPREERASEPAIARDAAELSEAATRRLKAFAARSDKTA